jgi:uncharacterized MAPEG superfamily protein
MRWWTGAEPSGSQGQHGYAVFTLAYWCVLVAALLPIVCAGMAKWGLWQAAQGGRLRQPRSARLAGAANRLARPRQCRAGQQLRGAAVLHGCGVVLRVVYILLYVGGQASARSLVWSLALAVNIGILFAGYH